MTVQSILLWLKQQVAPSAHLQLDSRDILEGDVLLPVPVLHKTARLILKMQLHVVQRPFYWSRPVRIKQYPVIRCRYWQCRVCGNCWVSWVMPGTGIRQSRFL